MSDGYLHGAYGLTQVAGSRVAAKSQNAMVLVGTAPVHTVLGGKESVNKPILVHDIAEARRYFGYSENWNDYTLCEAMHMFLERKAVGPLVLINVLDPEKHRMADVGTRMLKPVNGRITMICAESIILDSVQVGGFERDKDYAISYNFQKKTITITEILPGGLGDDAIEISYTTVDPSAVTENDVIGTSDGNGLNTGLYCMKNVYQITGYIPSFLLAPGFSSIPAVHAAMCENSRKNNNHWDAWLFVDLPLVGSDGTALTLDNVHAWRKENGYTKQNETVCFPMIQGTDGKLYHMSVVRAANFAQLLLENEGIPYHTASNTAAPIIANLWFGKDSEKRIYDDELINRKLCRNGISSAVYMGGRFVIWGAHAADYGVENKTEENASETARMMLYYISNDFQKRRHHDVDKPLSYNDVTSIVAEEQNRLDSLVKMGALAYGDASLNADEIARSDMLSGNYVFTFSVIIAPLAKSLTAIVRWGDDGYDTQFPDDEKPDQSDPDVKPSGKIIFESDENGAVKMLGAEFKVQSDGVVLICGAAFTDQGDGCVLID